MMRASHQPLAHLVDAAAEKWLAAETGPTANLESTRKEIIGSFRLGDQKELTFHGLRYLLTISRNRNELDVSVHEIARND